MIIAVGNDGKGPNSENQESVLSEQLDRPEGRRS
jgi:hypothetical protein